MDMVQHPQAWLPSEPSLQTGEKNDSERVGSDLGGVKSVPIRAVEAGEFILETWIEEGKAKRNNNTRKSMVWEKPVTDKEGPASKSSNILND